MQEKTKKSPEWRALKNDVFFKKIHKKIGLQ